MFKIYDGRAQFYQWDLDRKLIIEDSTITEVHFCNRTDSCSLVCETFAEDGLTLVNVPNILLQTDWRIHVYAYDGSCTKHDECFEVISRTKPADYVYTETEILTWKELDERLKVVEETQPSSPEGLEGKEDKANKVNSTKSEYWWDHYNDVEGYPNMSTVSNGMIHMQFNQIDPLKEQVNGLSGEVEELKENGVEITVEHNVDYGNKDSTNPISVKGVFPVYNKVENMEYKLMNLEPVVKQAHIARAFENYEALIDFYDALETLPFLNEIGGGAAAQGYYTPIGSSMYIQTLNVPDLWVKDRIITYDTEPFCADIKADAEAAGKSLDEYIVHKINTEGEFSIKWLKFAPLETQKVDLTNYYDKEEIDDMFADVGTGGDASTNKEWELVASYVHSGNRKIQPTALDKTTGYFTCENHGLTEGQTVIVLSNPEYFVTQLSYIPYELYQKCNYDNSRLHVRLKTVTIINENTFALVKSDSSIYTYTAPQSINADATKFYFETVDGGIFTGFNNLNIDMRDYDIKIVAKNPHIRVSLAINNYSNGYQYLTPYGGEGGIAFGVHVTPVCDVYSIGEAIWKFDGKVLTNDSRSTTRWGKTLTPLENIIITEGYINNIFIDSTNESFCENPIINKLNINFYLADKYMRNGGFIEIWKKKK